MIKQFLHSALGPLVRTVRQLHRNCAENLMRKRVSRSTSLASLNQQYLELTTAEQLSFYECYAKLFHAVRNPPLPGLGHWKTRFTGREFQIPLSQDWLWLDWDHALSLSVHDLDVKLGYQAFLQENAVDLFLDVGTNYGMHSLIFLKFGTPCLSFEPNVACHDYFLRLCEQNGVSAELFKVALGAQQGHVKLVYPERETWLSSANPAVQAELGRHYSLIELEVPMITLDSMLPRMLGKKVLMKIDTEGFELEVLKGAHQVLTQVRPFIYFEALPHSPQTNSVRELLESSGYLIREASSHPFVPGLSVMPAGFKRFESNNFLAIPTQ